MREEEGRAIILLKCLSFSTAAYSAFFLFAVYLSEIVHLFWIKYLAIRRTIFVHKY